MSRFFSGQRVIDRETGQAATVLQYAAKAAVIVQYDHAYDEEPDICVVDTAHLEAVTRNNTCLIIHEEAGKPLVATFWAGEHISSDEIVATFKQALTEYIPSKESDPLILFAADKVCHRHGASVDFYEASEVVDITGSYKYIK